MHLVEYTKAVPPFRARKFPSIPAWLPAAVAVTGLAFAVARHVEPQQEADWLSRLAQSGDSGAELQLALAYRDGRYGLQPDPKTGLYWLQQAAQAGNAYAADLVGNAYARGQGTAADPAEARHWWQIAAAGGNVDARHHLGDFAPDGLQSALDVVTGKAELDQSGPALQRRAEAGDPVAEYQLAMRYRDGAWGVTRNPELSRQWLERAAADGNPVARKTLASAEAKLTGTE